MVMVLAVMSSICVFAVDSSVLDSSTSIQLDYGDGPEINKYLDNKKVNEDLIGTKSTYNISLPILAFNQKDSDWADEYMETEHKKIGGYGCALTCVAMNFKYYGTSTDPEVLNNDLGNYACPIWWYKADDLGSDGNAEISVYDSSPTNTEVMNTCVASLSDGYPVIIGFQNPNDEEDTHFVLVKSVIGSGTSWLNYGVIDPNGGTTSNINNYLNAGYDFYRMVVYEEI